MNSKISQNRSPFDLLRLLAFFAFFSAATVFCFAVEVKEDRDVSSHKPVNISASQLTFDRPLGLTLFTGKVKALHDQVVIFADQIRALEENREATAVGHVEVIDHSQAITLTCGNLEYQDLMDLMTAHDHPVLTTLDENGRPITVLGRQMEVDSVKKTVVINQNVQILHKEGKAEAQRATFLSKQDKFILEEDPKVYTDNGLLSGRRITANMGEDRSLMVEGMADAIFNPNGKPVTAKAAGGPVTGTHGAVIPVSSPTPVANDDGLSHNDSVQPSATPGILPGQSPLKPGGPLW